jgi:hypothetical protein
VSRVAIASVLVLWGVAGVARPAHADEPPPLALVQAWFAQLYGFDALEAYESDAGGLRTEFTVARQWREGRARVLVDVRTPAALRNAAFLLLQRRERSDDLFYVANPGAPRPRWRVRRGTAAQLEVELPGLSSRVALMDLRPVLPGELRYRRLPDVEIEGELARVLECRPSGRDLGFDRLELTLSARTGVALLTRTFRGEREVRRVHVSPADVRRYGERWLPARRRITSGARGPETELWLRSVVFDPVLPDTLFTRQSLLVQRFPAP